MKHDELIDRVRLMQHYMQTKTTAIDPAGPVRQPISTYTDQDQWERERELIFGRTPALICFSCDVGEPGDYRTHDDLGIPLFVIRGQDGRVRAFLNACSHRASRLLEGSGHVNGKVVCPYHAWAYGLAGELAGIHKADTVGPIDRDCYGLKQLPCEEKYGFIYVSPDPEAALSVDEHLGSLATDFSSWELGRGECVKRGSFEIRSNWKLALDTFCEGYHFQPLHPMTIGNVSMTNCSTYDRFGKDGEHHRLGFPAKTMEALIGRPESEWDDPMKYCNFVYQIFPNIVLMVSAGTYEFFQVYPGRHVNEHVTRYSLYSRTPIGSEEDRENKERHFDFVYGVVESDDYKVSASVQKNFDAGLLSHTTFGQNEPALINLHRTLRLKTGLPPVDEPAHAEARA